MSETGPLHIAIIPDGNRRWGKQNKLSLIGGHQQGAENLIRVVSAMPKLGVKMTTLYVFSTENWERSPTEVKVFMKLLSRYLEKTIPQMCVQGVRFHTIGDLEKLPQSVLRVVEKAKKETEGNSSFDLVLALNYGGRDEIVRACRRLAGEVAAGKIGVDEIDEKKLSRQLDTGKWSEPDLVIRTSGEMRISNFLLWQTAYSELYCTDVLWPDFTEEHLMEAVATYQNRQRRKGK